MSTPVTVTFDVNSIPNVSLFAILAEVQEELSNWTGIANVKIEIDTTQPKPFAFASAFTSVVQTVADMAGINPDDIKNFVRPPA